jgi:hypothetical protein
MEIEVALASHHRVSRVQIVLNGEVVRSWDRPAGVTQETFRDTITVPSEGWVAARCFSHARDSFLQEIYAHTSPVYLRTGAVNPFRTRDAHWFTEQIDEALEIWIGSRFRYASDAQREGVRELFRAGRAVYARLKSG